MQKRVMLTKFLKYNILKIKTLTLIGALCLCGLGSSAATRYVGGDISMLPDFEGAGATYFTHSGEKINDLITYSFDQGMNAMRVRLFVDPETFISNNLSTIKSSQDNYYMARANQSYDYILPLCKRIQAAGHKLLLDFHYSDTWADPSNQYTPALWASLSDSELANRIYDYTKEVLNNLKKEGVVPEFIQTGNEISYGMCYMPYGGSGSKKIRITDNSANVTRFKNLLQNAIKACREVVPESKIVLHTERVANTSYTISYYDWAKNNNIDYDIIGLSYYFYYHGRISQLESTLNAIENRKYGKDIWIVETGCYINWAMGDSDKQYYDATDAGQNQFVSELLAALDKHSSVKGLFWWEMDYNAKGANTSGDYYFINNWYNASLFDNNTGKATSAFSTFASWNKEVEDKDDDNPGNDKDAEYYLLYNNNNASWEVPGTKFNVNGSGVYTLTGVTISGSSDGSSNGWFGITTDSGTDWTAINANRIGPATANEDPTTMEYSKAVVGNELSWEVPGGIYDIFFDAGNMELSVKVTNGDSNSIGSIGAEDGEIIYYDLRGVRIKTPQKGIYLMVRNGKTQKILVK